MEENRRNQKEGKWNYEGEVEEYRAIEVQAVKINWKRIGDIDIEGEEWIN